MRVTTGRENGELTVINSQILHFFDGARIQKFYQQMHLQFISDPDLNGDSVVVHWAVSNWGPGSEAPWVRSGGNRMTGDLKGGIKVEGHSARYMAEQACDRLLNAKLKKGYNLHSTLMESDGLEPGHRLLSELGLTPSTVEKKPQTVPFASNLTICEENCADLEETIGATATYVLTALAAGDLPGAIAYRQDLLNTMARVRTVQEGAEGRMAMLNAKLAEAIR